MVNIYIAYTQAVNPDSATPVLTRGQLWSGLRRKVRKAQEFVPVITSCEVLKEEGSVVTRNVYFKEGFGPGATKPVKEVCTEYAPTKVDFHQEDSSVIQNIISDGPGGTDKDLFMTYAFEWQHPDIEAGSAKEEELKTKYKKMSKMAVDESISAIRKMVVAGEL